MPQGRKRKMVAAFLALFFGMFGVHRFYLGQRGRGIAFLAAFSIAMIATIEGDQPIMAIVAIVAFIDSVLLFAMPREDFDAKYNQGRAIKTRSKARRVRRQKLPDTGIGLPWSGSSLQTAIDKGKNLFIKGRWQEAIQCFDQVLEIDEEHPEAHYYLASCFSLLKDEENAFIHLALAVKNGFKDLSKIESDLNLYYLRSQASYSGFVSNGYKLVNALPEPQKGLLDSDRFDPLILDKIELLGEKLERGELSQAEFQLEKEKVLRGE
ncbi:MAG: NINE protein [Saprospiraceae bacterium]|nr:NINE protein [Saprospiraceae bacterium]